MTQFDNFALLFLLVLLLPLVWIFVKRVRSKQNVVSYSDTKLVKSLPKKSWRKSIRYIPPVLKAIAFIVLIIALARPQSISSEQEVNTEGIDIMLVMDISGSMMAMDFQPNRMQAAKRVASEFIKARTNDRIGLTLFAKFAFTQSPLTIDHNALQASLSSVEIGLTDADNTAIGSAIASAANRLRSSDSKSKVIILLTDGENNFGVPPLTSTEAAHALGIKIYTIGVSTYGRAPFPARDMFGRQTTQMVPVDIDDDMLTQIATMTGGKYYRATDDRALENIFADIDQLERTKIEIKAYRRYKELFPNLILSGLILLSLGLFISSALARELV